MCFSNRNRSHDQYACSRRSEEHTSELQSPYDLVCRLLLEKKNHYGRWVMVGGVWGWVPVPPRPRYVTVGYVRQVYAPAMVAWVGGAHWGVVVAVGGAPAAG